MSFFIASVPQDTLLYHGTSTYEPVTGTEWLAFEPEHALAFAFPARRPRPRAAAADNNDECPGAAGCSRSIRWATHDAWAQNPAGPHVEDARPAWESPHGAALQEPLGTGVSDSSSVPDVPSGGYFHTYRTKRALNLIYIDGMSAAKCEKGTLDSTDGVLLGLDLNTPRRVMFDYARAVALCNLSRDKWGGRVDGFLRMEMGFEVILCDFARHVAVDSIVQTPGRSLERAPLDVFRLAHLRAVAARYDGIGGSRVMIDYDDFVTAFSHDVDLFDGDSLAMPRLLRASNETLSQILGNVTYMIEHHPKDSLQTVWAEGSRNWQSVVDMVVDRYAGRLESLAAVSTLEQFQIDAEILLRPYIDYGARDRSAEIQRCTAQYPASAKAPLAARAIRSVATTICDTLLGALDTPDLKPAQSSVKNLMSYLQWPVWKRCRGCVVNEECYIPMWPSGRKQDYETPECQNEGRPCARAAGQVV
ncbi:hypothetical protein AURDEDRAFT_146297 [Auricularia subglabra TFB-10046 SS5]|nr:hypothetical protein AURDEDRAFT_146297 [Auricularia subglabra TFB-10046 SS5]